MKLNDDQPKRFFDEQTDKRRHEHIEHKEDVITETDIANIRTDIDNTEYSAPPQTSLPPEKEKKLNDRKIKDDTDPEISNDSWNVLES